MKLLIGWLLGVMFTGFGCALFAPGRPAERPKTERRKSSLYIEDLRRERGWK